MKCSIVTIGTELTLGLIINENARYLCEKLTEMGLECNYVFTVRDNIDEIRIILKNSLKYSDIVIISGGLGPTDDDVTRKAVAETLNLNLIRDTNLDQYSLKFKKKVISEQIKQHLLRQSYVPEGAIPIKPKIGSASGFKIEIKDGRKYIFCIPGVPKEMKSMFEEDIIDDVKKIFTESMDSKVSGKIFKSTLLTTDISESEIEQKIKSISKEANKINIQIGITANPGLIKIILISNSENEEIAQKNLKLIEDKITDKLKGYIYGKDNSIISENLKTIIENLKKGITISVAESITGGLISSIITDTPGSSNFFKGGIISYSDFAKKEVLDISEEKIKKFGAVSREVCLDMAKNVRKIFNSDFAVSVTGYAGPEAEKNKLGLVYCCIMGPENIKKIFKKEFLGTRTEIKFRTAQFIINELKNLIAKF